MWEMLCDMRCVLTYGYVICDMRNVEDPSPCCVRKRDVLQSREYHPISLRCQEGTREISNQIGPKPRALTPEWTLKLILSLSQK